MAQNPNPSLLDPGQIVKRAFDGDEDRIRVDATISATLGDVQITDGSKDVTITTVGSKNGLDVNILNDIEISIDQANDSIKIGDGTNLITSTNVSGKQGLDVNVINSVNSANLREQVVTAPDVVESLTWADFNSNNERVTEIVYVSASVGHTATKEFNYTPVNGAYQLDSINWSVV